MSTAGTSSRMVAPIIALIARILIALPLIKFGTDKIRNWDAVYPWMQYIHFPLPALALGLANTIEVVGAVCLIVGFRVRWAAMVIALYLVPVTLTVHHFWSAEASDRAGMVEDFGKGMMIIGGLLFTFLSRGAGPLSLDAWLESRKRARAAQGASASVREA